MDETKQAELLYKMMRSGFVKEVENTGEAYRMEFWDDDANVYAFERPTLEKLLLSADDWFNERITYEQLGASQIGDEF